MDYDPVRDVWILETGEVVSALAMRSRQHRMEEAVAPKRRTWLPIPPPKPKPPTLPVPPPTPKPPTMAGPWPTVDTWVSRSQDGASLTVVKVVDMTNDHLWRWILLFRRKWRDKGFVGTDAALDAEIRGRMVTAPAIYAEAQKRGVMVLETLSSAPSTWTVPEVLKGVTLTPEQQGKTIWELVAETEQRRAADRPNGNIVVRGAARGVRRITLDEE